MKKLIVGNWKCNPSSAKKAEELIKASDRVNVVICPPFVFLNEGKLLKNASLGAQDVFWEDGARTGEISVSQLKGLGVKYVIVGHSERRALGETNDSVFRKTEAVVKAGMKAIVCVGEPIDVRKIDITAAEEFVALQVSAVEPLISSKKLIFAYEPIWAIGTGVAATTDDAVSMTNHIRSCCGTNKIAVLYGGSISSKNAKDFLDRPEISGLLVGGASIDSKEFGKIIDIAL